MKIFVAYPYKLEGYRDALAKALPGPTYELLYADEHLASDHVLRKIERMLEDCDLAIFDLTGANPNVTLELGISIAAEHPYIVAIQRDSINGLNADIHGWDQIRYESVEGLGETIRRYIERGRVPKRISYYPDDAEYDSSVSPLGQKPFPVVSLQPQSVNPDSIFGLQIRPKSYNRNRHTMTNDDDAALLRAVESSRGPRGDWHSFLAPVPGYVNGVHFSTPQPTTRRGDGSIDIAYEQILIDSDGEIIVRFRQNDERPIYQYLALLATGFILARDTFAVFGIKPHALFDTILRLDARRLNDEIKLPQFFKDDFVVDLEHQGFAEAFLDPTLRIFRASAAKLSQADGLDILKNFQTT